jgi:hypothetical protein
MLQGSLSLVQGAQIVKAAAAVLQYGIPFLLVYALSRATPRVLLWLALILTIVGNLGVVVLPIGEIELVAIDAASQELYAPQFTVDYTRGAYPVLLGMGYLGGVVLYAVVYDLLARRFFKGDQFK